jgi:hypothetical protein
MKLQITCASPKHDTYPKRKQHTLARMAAYPLDSQLLCLPLVLLLIIN